MYTHFIELISTRFIELMYLEENMYTFYIYLSVPWGVCVHPKAMDLLFQNGDLVPLWDRDLSHDPSIAG